MRPRSLQVWAAAGWEDVGPELHGLCLAGADLEGVRLWRMRLRGVDLSGARLCSSNLAGAVLAEVDLRSADLADACLQSADLSRAVLVEKGKIGEDRATRNTGAVLNLQGARYDRHTRWPEGFRPEEHGARLVE